MKKPRPVHLALAAGLLLAVAAFLYARRAAPRRPDVILVSIDSLRPDHLGCYGYRRPTSPVLDRLAAEGALFETAVSSSSWTLPAHAALFTSLPDRLHGCFDDSRWLDRSRKTLAEACQEAGLKTVGFFAGPFLHPAFGFAQGFDTYHDCTSYCRKTIAMLKRGMFTDDLDQLSHQDVTNPTVLREVTRWLDKNPEGPAFMFIHLWDVHFDYLPPAPYDRLFDPDYTGPVNGVVKGINEQRRAWPRRDVEHLEALYDGEIRWTDATLGKILAALDRRGRLANAIVAVTADHGEAFFEHGLHGHRHDLFEETLRIPLVLHYPARIPAGTRVRTPVHLMDVAPTLLRLAGLPPLPHAFGRSLVPLIEAPAAPRPDAAHLAELVVPSAGTHLFCIRRRRWKFIFDLPHGTAAVYDLRDDPGETTPLPEAACPVPPADVKALYADTARRLQHALEQLPDIGARDTPPIDKMTDAQLRKLGYLR